MENSALVTECNSLNAERERGLPACIAWTAVHVHDCAVTGVPRAYQRRYLRMNSGAVSVISRTFSGRELAPFASAADASWCVARDVVPPDPDYGAVTDNDGPDIPVGACPLGRQSVALCQVALEFFVEAPLP
jgi:hypothetical protein